VGEVVAGRKACIAIRLPVRHDCGCREQPARCAEADCWLHEPITILFFDKEVDDMGAAMNPHSQAMLATNPMCTTAFELPGYRIVRSLGVVRGIVVRSRSVVGNFAAGVQSLFGGNITILTGLCEHARGEAFDLMIQHANQLGANAVIAVRYDANEIMTGASEVLAYGTAVVVEALDDARQ
jgi:uncharacterized protein YbjQ (UPF0145 family)